MRCKYETNKKQQRDIIAEIDSLIKMKDFSGAQYKIEDFYHMFGSNCYIRLEEGRLRKEEGNVDEALRILSDLYKEYPPNNGYVIYELGLLYAKTGNLSKAIEIFETIELTNHKDKTYVYFELAKKYFILRNYDKAYEFFDKVARNNGKPYFVELSKIGMARIKIENEQYEEAKKILKSISYGNDNNQCATILFYEAKIYKKLGQIDELEEILEKILNTYDKNHLGTCAELLIIKIKKKDYIEAGKLFKKLKDTQSDEVLSTYALAEYYFMIRDNDKALELYQKLLLTDNSYYELSLLSMSKILVMKNKFDEALELYQRILDKKGIFYNKALYYIISLHIKNKDYNKAYEYYQMMENQEALKNDELFKRIKLLLEIRTNIITVPEYSEYYSRKQILHYDRDLALIHIQAHQNVSDKEKESEFSSDIEIEKLYDEVSSQLVDSNICSIGCFTKYRIFYPNIGVFKNNKLEYLDVVTIPDTKEIITMYPSDENYSDLDQNEEMNKQKVKENDRMTQIEKFNKRYNIKN